MVSSWLRSLFTTKCRPLANGRRAAASFRPTLARLDERVVPAVAGTLLQSGSILYYNGTALNNVITVSGTNGALTINDTAGTINTNVPGFAGAGTNTVTGAIPGAVTQIIINGQTGFDTINVKALDITRKVQVVGELINLNADTKTAGVNLQVATAGLITLNGVSVNTANTPVGGDIVFTGNVLLKGAKNALVTDSVTDGNITFNGAVTSAAGSQFDINVQGLAGPANAGGNVTFNNFVTVDGPVFIGNNAGGVFVDGANKITFHKGATTGGIYMSARNAIQLGGNLISTFDDITIRANQDGVGSEGFTQTAGDIITVSTNALGAGNVTEAVSLVVNQNALGGGNGTATIRGITTGVGGGVTIDTGSQTGGGAIIDGNSSALNINTGLGGFTTLIAGGKFLADNINLDTRTSDLYAEISDPGAVGNIVIRNTSFDLNLVAARTNKGSVTINNAGGNIVLDDSVFTDVVNATGDVTLTAATEIVNGAGATPLIVGDKVTLTAQNGKIGAVASSIVLDALSLMATATNGIFVATDPASTNGLTVLGATTATGNIALETTNAAIDLTIGGNVATSGGTVDLTSARDVHVTGGNVVGSGNVSVNADRNIWLATNRSIIGNNIVLASGTQNSTIGISGSITANGTLNIIGSTGVQTIGVSGSLSSGGLTTIDVSGSAAGSSVTVSGMVQAPQANFVGSAAGSTTMAVAPSLFTPFDFAFSGAGNFLFINTNVSNIIAASMTFASPITFTIFQTWTNSGAGAVTVSPSV